MCVRFRGGARESEDAFRDGKPEGHWATWHNNGRQAGDANFRDGRPTGAFTAWHANGQKSAEGRFADGPPAGDLTVWDAGGRRRVVIRFADGQMAGMMAWDPQGRPITDPEQMREQQQDVLGEEPNTLLMMVMFMSVGATR